MNETNGLQRISAEAKNLCKQLGKGMKPLETR